MDFMKHCNLVCCYPWQVFNSLSWHTYLWQRQWFCCWCYDHCIGNSCLLTCSSYCLSEQTK